MPSIWAQIGIQVAITIILFVFVIAFLALGLPDLLKKWVKPG